jgi:hypothetical protein
MEKFDQISGNDSRGELLQNENYMDAIKANSGRYKIENALTLLFRLWNYYVFR